MRTVKAKGGGAGCCAGSKRATTRRSCERTATQNWHAEEDVPPVVGLYVPCAMARRFGGNWFRWKGAGQAAAQGAKGRPRAGHANAPPRKRNRKQARLRMCLWGKRSPSAYMMTSHPCCTRPAQWREGAGENVKGERRRGRLLRGERKGDHAQGMQNAPSRKTSKLLSWWHHGCCCMSLRGRRCRKCCLVCSNSPQCNKSPHQRCCTCPAQWRGVAGENGQGGRGRGRLLRGERKGDLALGMQTHNRARLARNGRRAARVWVVLALRNGAEVRVRMVKGEGGGDGCWAGSERATTRRKCKRTAAHDWHAAENVLPVFGLYLPCAMARRCE